MRATVISTRWFPFRERTSFTLALLLVGCGASESGGAHADPPAHVEHPEPESDLAVVHLSQDAMRRLAIETGAVGEADVRATRLVGGEVIVPPGRIVAVTAPVAGTIRTSLMPGARVSRGDILLRLVPIAPVDRDVRARADREVSATRAQAEMAEARVTRVESLMAERAGSQRLLDEAIAARDIARADVAQAEARARTTRSTPLLADVSMTVRAPGDGLVRALSAVSGQAVAAGAAILEIVEVDALQVRVPVYSGDLGRLDPEASASVERLSGHEAPVSASPVAAPPTADVLGGTVDRYFALDPTAVFSLGERVVVQLALREEATARVVPHGSVVYDAQGGAWVYACEGENAFRRMRIDPVRVSGDQMVISSGPPVGTCVASVGAAEIFGSEFPPGH